MKNPEWLTAKEVGEYLRIASRTVLDIAKRGEFGPVARFGGQYRFSPRQVEDYIQASTGQPYQAPTAGGRPRHRKRIQDAPKLGQPQ